MAYLYNNGFIIASISYRSTTNEHMFPAQVHDVKTAIRYLRRNANLYNIDSTKIGLAGHSAGAHLAALVGTSYRDCYLEGAELGHVGYSSAVQAVYTLAAPVDLTIPITKNCIENECPNAISLLLGCCEYDDLCGSDILYNTNPISYVNGDEPPFYMVHGSADCTVSPQNSVLLNAALESTSSNLNIINGASHFPSSVINSDDYNQIIYDFFDANLNAEFTEDQWEIIQDVYIVETKSNLVESCGAKDGRLVLRFENGVKNDITIEGYTVAQAINQFSEVIFEDADGDLVIKERPAAEFTIRNTVTTQSGDIAILNGCCSNTTNITANMDLINCKSDLTSKKIRPCRGSGGVVVACMPKSYLNTATIEGHSISGLLNNPSGDYYLNIDGDFVMENRIPATYTFAKGSEFGDVVVENDCTLSFKIDEPRFNNEKNHDSLWFRATPNPVTDLIFIEFVNETKGIQAIEILDLNGQIIKQILPNNLNQQVYVADISDLKTGIYIVRVSKEKSVQITKIIKY